MVAADTHGVVVKAVGIRQDVVVQSESIATAIAGFEQVGRVEQDFQLGFVTALKK